MQRKTKRKIDVVDVTNDTSTSVEDASLSSSSSLHQQPPQHQTTRRSLRARKLRTEASSSSSSSSAATIATATKRKSSATAAPQSPPLPPHCATRHTAWALVFQWLPRNQQFLVRTVCSDWNVHAMSTLFGRPPTTEQLLLLPPKKNPFDYDFFYTFRPSFYRKEFERPRMTDEDRVRCNKFYSLLRVHSCVPIAWATPFGHVRSLSLYLTCGVPWNIQPGFFDGLAQLRALEDLTFTCVSSTQVMLGFHEITNWADFSPTLHTIRMVDWVLCRAKHMKFVAYPPGLTLLLYEMLRLTSGEQSYPCQDGLDNRVTIREKTTDLIADIARILEYQWYLVDAGRAEKQSNAVKLLENAQACGVTLFDPQLRWDRVDWNVMDFLIHHLSIDECMWLFACASTSTRSAFVRTTYIVPSRRPNPLPPNEETKRAILRGASGGGAAAPHAAMGAAAPHAAVGAAAPHAAITR